MMGISVDHQLTSELSSEVFPQMIVGGQSHTFEIVDSPSYNANVMIFCWIFSAHNNIETTTAIQRTCFNRS
jgi:hypothetical protein